MVREWWFGDADFKSEDYRRRWHCRATSSSYSSNGTGDSSEWDEFGDADSKSKEELDPGSWLAVSGTGSSANFRSQYSRLMDEATSEIELAAT